MANYPGGRALFKEIAGPFQQKAGGALKEDGTIRNALSAKEGSYRQLLALQGIHYDSSSSGDGTLFCSDIELLGMRCRSGVDSSRNLNALQLPAVISIDNNGIRQYATLLELKNGTAIISSGDKSEAVRAEHMTSVWTGEYMMLETSGEKAESKTDAARSGTAQVKR
jgi:hypothetical protein